MRSVDVRVAVVDDSRAFRAALAELVEAAAGFALVGEADSGEGAIRLVQERLPDMVLLDVRLGGVDGVEAAERIAALGLPVVVVLLTAGDMDPLTERARRAGAAAIIDKQQLRTSMLREVWASRTSTGGATTP